MADYDLGTAKGKLVLDSSGVTRGVDEAGRSIDGLDSKSRNSAGGLRVLELGLLAVGAAGFAAFSFAIKKAADFEASMSGIKAVSGATADQMELLRKKALKLGADTVFSAGEASSAMEELAKSGLSVDDILNGAADATVNLAAAGQIALPEAAKIAANAMNQFGLAAEDLPHVADLIAGAANASAIDVSDFGMSMAQAGAVANLTGLSFDDMALAITAMGNAGIKGSDAGTSLKTFLSGLQPTTEKQIKLFDQLGLTIDANATSMNATGNAFFDAQGKVKPMGEIAGQLATALAGMSEQQKSATLEMLFGSDAIRAAAIIADTGAEGFDTLAASMGGISAADVATTRMDNFKGSMEQLKGSVETAAINIGTLFLPALKDVADQATGWVNKFGEMDESTQKFIVKTGAGVTAAAGLAGGLGLFAHTVAPVVSGIGGMMSAFAGLASSLFITTTVVEGVEVAALSAFAVFMIWVVAIAAVVAAFVYAYKHFEAFRNIVDTIARAVRDFAILVADWFMNTILPALRTFADFFMKTIVPAIAAFVSSVIGFVEKVVAFFTDVLVPGIKKAFGAIQDVIMSFWGWFDEHVISTAAAFIDLLIAIFDKVLWFVENILIPYLQVAWAVLAPIIMAVFDVISSVISNAMTFIMGVIRIAMDVIMGIINVFVDIATTAWRLFGDNILSAITLIFNFIKGVIETVLDVIRGIMQVLTGLITGDWGKAWDGIKLIFTTIWDFIKLYVDTAINAIKLIIETVLDAIHLIFVTVWDLIKLVLTTAWDAIKLAAKTVWEAIKLAITAPIELITAILQGIWDGILTAAKIVWDDIKGTAETIWNALVDSITKPIGIARDMLKDIWDVIKSTAKAAWEGVKALIEPVIDAIVRVIQKIIDIAQDAVDAVKSIPKKIGGFLPSLSGDDVPFVPGIAEGGIIVRKMLAYVGEAGPEAVIPLTNAARAIELMRASGLDLLAMGSFNGPSMAIAPPTMDRGGSTSSAPPATFEGSSNYEGVHIEQAHFYEGVDISMLMAQADFAIEGARL